MSNILSKLKNLPADLKKLNNNERAELAVEIRTELIDILARAGGHVGPNLGVIELAIALHTIFDSPIDKIIWDISHQSLPHKILTGRNDLVRLFHQNGGASPFTNSNESDHDLFNIGHTSTSVSLACGLAKARDILDGKENVVAILGDGALSGGEAWEGLNVGGALKTNFIVILNDNEMSMDENVGGIYSGLAKLRASQGKDENNIFRALGYDYIYVEEGNDVNELTKILSEVKDIDHPIVVHVHTEKAHGLDYAAKNISNWHWHGPFDMDTGKPTESTKSDQISGQEALVNYLIKNENTEAIVAGTPTLGSRLPAEIPDRFHDVAIAEQTAIAFGSGMAKRFVLNKSGGGNMRRPYVVLWSSFAQRAYDQILQDWTLNDTPMTLVIVRAGISESDFTHHGDRDIPMLNSVANLVYLAPTSVKEFEQMLKWSHKQPFPVAIRAIESISKELNRKTPEIIGSYVDTDENIKVTTASGGIIPKDKFVAQSEVYRSGSKVAIFGLGTFFWRGVELADTLKIEKNINATVINPRFISHLDTKVIDDLVRNHNCIVTLEDGQIEGGFGEKLATYIAENHPTVRVLVRGSRSEYPDYVSYDALMVRYRLTQKQLVEDISTGLQA